ncbi:AAA family ATPase [Candidatus Pacearchaeota archaeon]|nr:AAA family ATPase [Candidatus Pacearchaeota archaeon]
MLLKKITLNNIRSYEHQEIEFTKGSTLLSGDIGSGKTSILLGIEFALFGLQPGQRGSALLRNQEKQGGVIMEFEVGGKEVIVERTLKQSSKSISQDYCAITVDNEKKELSVTELKNKILELLDYPKEFSKKQNILYKFTVYTPQEEMKQIILQDSETRLNTLRHVFGIDKYKKVLENTSILTSKIREEKRIKQGFTETLELDKQNIVSKEIELESKQKNLVLIEGKLLLKIENRKKIEKEKQAVSEKIQEKNKLEQEVEKTKLMISAKKENFSENKKLVGELKNQIEELNKLSFDKSKILNLENEIKLKKQEKEMFNQSNLEINSQINSLISKNEESKKLEQKISNLEVCPTCLQEVVAVYRANVLNKIHNDLSQNNKKLESLEFEKKQISEKIKIIDLEIYSKEKETADLKMIEIKLQGITEKQMRLVDVEKSNVSFEKDIEILNTHIETLNNSVFVLSRFDNLFELKQKEFEHAFREERIAEIKSAELKKEIEVFSVYIRELKEKIKKAEEVREQLNYLTKLETWLSKEFASFVSLIEKNVMIKLKAEFSKLFDEWFCMLVSDSFDISLTDDFTPIIEHQDYEIDYAYLSGGERTAVALAYRLALNQVINSLMSKIKTRDIVILDEPTDGFSAQQLDKMRDVLQQLNIKQLIIVSHEQKIEGFVENVIRFRKVNGVSVMES